jgi:hypothetical protein
MSRPMMDTKSKGAHLETVQSKPDYTISLLYYIYLFHWKEPLMYVWCCHYGYVISGYLCSPLVQCNITCIHFTVYEVDKWEILSLQKFPCLDRLKSKCSVVDIVCPIKILFSLTLSLLWMKLICHREFGWNMPIKYTEVCNTAYFEKYHCVKINVKTLSWI